MCGNRWVILCHASCLLSHTLIGTPLLAASETDVSMMNLLVCGPYDINEQKRCHGVQPDNRFCENGGVVQRHVKMRLLMVDNQPLYLGVGVQFTQL